jgi:hypothetical protein
MTGGLPGSIGPHTSALNDSGVDIVLRLDGTDVLPRLLLQEVLLRGMERDS